MKPRFIIVFAVALAAILGVAVWFVTAPEQKFEDHPWPSPAPVKPSPATPVPVVTAPPAAPPQPPHDRRAIDPEIQKLADRLADHSQTPLNDLEIVNEFVELYRKTFSNLPVGSNEDLTGILTGANPMKGVLFPTDSPMIVKNQIVDRWGSPYWIHPNSGARIEIRSAGPDKDLFTSDDVILNASPGGLGVTPEHTP